MVACNIGDIKSGMTMHTNNKLLDEIEQRALAERVLLNILRATLTRLACPYRVVRFQS